MNRFNYTFDHCYFGNHIEKVTVFRIKIKQMIYESFFFELNRFNEVTVNLMFSTLYFA